MSNPQFNCINCLNLDMHHTLLFVLLIGFSSCSGLRDINLSSEKTTVNLSKRGLTALPDELRYNTSIKVLRLYGNNIKELPEWIGELQSLEKLYLGKNKLTSLPESIGQLKNLKLLSAQYNAIEQLPASIVELENLQQLILNQNKLKTLPDSIHRLKKMEILQLKFNELTVIPPSIGGCEQLQFIYLNRNFLEELPTELGDLRKLRELYLSGAGPLLNLPESLCGLRYFEVLETDFTTLIPPCLIVQQTTRLRIIQR